MTRSPDGRRCTRCWKAPSPANRPAPCGSTSSTCAPVRTPASAGSTSSKRRHSIGDATRSTATGSWSSSATTGRATRPSSSGSTSPTWRDRDHDGARQDPRGGPARHREPPRRGRLRRHLPLPVPHDRGRADPGRPYDRRAERQQLPVLHGRTAGSRTTTSSSPYGCLARSAPTPASTSSQITQQHSSRSLHHASGPSLVREGPEVRVRCLT